MDATSFIAGAAKPAAANKSMPRRKMIPKSKSQVGRLEIQKKDKKYHIKADCNARILIDGIRCDTYEEGRQIAEAIIYKALKEYSEKYGGKNCLTDKKGELYSAYLQCGISFIKGSTYDKFGAGCGSGKTHKNIDKNYIPDYQGPADEDMRYWESNGYHKSCVKFDFDADYNFKETENPKCPTKAS